MHRLWESSFAKETYKWLKSVSRHEFPPLLGVASGHPDFRRFEVDHVIPRSRGGTDHIDNLQLLCGHCNRIKGDRPQEYLVARLAEIVG